MILSILNCYKIDSLMSGSSQNVICFQDVSLLFNSNNNHHYYYHYYLMLWKLRVEEWNEYHQNVRKGFAFFSIQGFIDKHVRMIKLCLLIGQGNGEKKTRKYTYSQ